MDHPCDFDTDCYAWRCGDCQSNGKCGCPPEAVRFTQSLPMYVVNTDRLHEEWSALLDRLVLNGTIKRTWSSNEGVLELPKNTEICYVS